MDTNELHRLLDRGFGWEEIVNHYKSEIIKEVVRSTNGNRSKACRILKIHRNSFHRLVVRLHLENELKVCGLRYSRFDAYSEHKQSSPQKH